MSRSNGNFKMNYVVAFFASYRPVKIYMSNVLCTMLHDHGLCSALILKCVRKEKDGKTFQEDFFHHLHIFLLTSNYLFDLEIRFKWSN